MSFENDGDSVANGRCSSWRAKLETEHDDLMPREIKQGGSFTMWVLLLVTGEGYRLMVSGGSALTDI